MSGGGGGGDRLSFILSGGGLSGIILSGGGVGGSGVGLQLVFSGGTVGGDWLRFVLTRGGAFDILVSGGSFNIFISGSRLAKEFVDDGLGGIQLRVCFLRSLRLQRWHAL